MPNIYSEFASALLNGASLVRVLRFGQNKILSFGSTSHSANRREDAQEILSAAGFAVLPKEIESRANKRKGGREQKGAVKIGTTECSAHAI